MRVGDVRYQPTDAWPTCSLRLDWFIHFCVTVGSRLCWIFEDISKATGKERKTSLLSRLSLIYLHITVGPGVSRQHATSSSSRCRKLDDPEFAVPSRKLELVVNNSEDFHGGFDLSTEGFMAYLLSQGLDPSHIPSIFSDLSDAEKAKTDVHKVTCKP